MGTSLAYIIFYILKNIKLIFIIILALKHLNKLIQNYLYHKHLNNLEKFFTDIIPSSFLIYITHFYYLNKNT